MIVFLCVRVHVDRERGGERDCYTVRETIYSNEETTKVLLANTQ